MNMRYVAGAYLPFSCLFSLGRNEDFMMDIGIRYSFSGFYLRGNEGFVTDIKELSRNPI